VGLGQDVEVIVRAPKKAKTRGTLTVKTA